MNLGNAVLQAAILLKLDPTFKQVRDGLRDFAVKEMIAACESPPEFRVDRTAYARAAYDLWQALEAPVLGVRQNQILPPTLPAPTPVVVIADEDDDEVSRILAPAQGQTDTAAALAKPPAPDKGKK